MKLAKYLTDKFAKMAYPWQMLYFSFLLVMFSLFIGIILIIFFSVKSDWINPSGSAGSFMQGSLGVAVAFAGAWVAIKIAESANKTLELQVRLENERHRDEQLQEASCAAARSAERFFSIRIGFEELYEVLHVMYRHINEQYLNHAESLMKILHANRDYAGSAPAIYNWLRSVKCLERPMENLQAILQNQAVLIKTLLNQNESRILYQKLSEQYGMNLDDLLKSSLGLYRASYRTEEIAYFLLIHGIESIGLNSDSLKKDYLDKIQFTQFMRVLGKSLSSDDDDAYSNLINVMRIFDIKKLDPEAGDNEYKEAMKSTLEDSMYSNEIVSIFLESNHCKRIAESGQYSARFQKLLLWATNPDPENGMFDSILAVAKNAAKLQIQYSSYMNALMVAEYELTMHKNELKAQEHFAAAKSIIMDFAQQLDEQGDHSNAAVIRGQLQNCEQRMPAHSKQ